MKIDREKMRQIGEAVKERERMRQIIRASYGNDALAQRFGVNVRTIEKLAALHHNKTTHEPA
jgi:hypothetical protein